MEPRRTGRDARLTLSVLVSIAGLTTAGSARAQAESAEQVAAARELGTEGVRLAEAGDCTNAVDKLTRAESLHHAPTTLERLGECHVSLGKLVVGTEELQRVFRETLAPNAPAAFTAAQDRAKKAYDAAAPRIGKLRIHVDHPDGVKVAVKVDDESVFDAMLDADRPTDPGTHKVTAAAQGMKPAEASVTMKDGESANVSLKLEADPNALATAPVPAPVPAAAPAPPPDQAPPPSDAPASSHSKVPAIVAFSAGGVGVVLGTVFGIMALSTKSSLDSACVNKGCPASSQSDISSLGTQATVSTIGFGVGIVGVGLGTYFLLSSSGGSSAAATASNQPHVVPFFGPGSAGLTGTF